MTGYSNRTSLEIDIVDVNSITDSLGIAIQPRGIPSGLDKEFIAFSVQYISTGNYRKRLSYTDVDGVELQVDIPFSGTVTKAYYLHTYTLEIYDYLQQTGSDSVSRATWQWKVKEDGSTLMESHNGTSQLHARFAAAPPPVGVGTSWCTNPVIRVTHQGFSFPSTSMEFDNLKLNVNGDESCSPPPPPVPPV